MTKHRPYHFITNERNGMARNVEMRLKVLHEFVPIDCSLSEI